MTITERNRLTLEYQSLAKRLAYRLWKNRPSVRLIGDLEDVEQVALIGLMRAAELYDFSRGTAFRSFAHAKIQFAILDAARGAAPIKVPREFQGKGADVLKWNLFSNFTSEDGATPEELAVDGGDADSVDTRDEVLKLIQPLLTRQRNYLRDYFGLEGPPRPMKIVAVLHDVSERRVSQDIAAAIKWLRDVHPERVVA